MKFVAAWLSGTNKSALEIVPFRIHHFFNISKTTPQQISLRLDLEIHQNYTCTHGVTNNN